MKKVDNIGEISISPNRVEWKVTKFSDWPKFKNDTLIRSPRFHYAGGDRYFSAQLKFDEGSVIFTGLSITCCSRDRHDFYCFIFGVFGDYGTKVFLMTGPDVHGGCFFTSDFKEKKNQIIKSNGDIHFFCQTLPASEDETDDGMAVLPMKSKKEAYKDVATQTDEKNDITRTKDQNSACSSGAFQNEVENGPTIIAA